MNQFVIVLELDVKLQLHKNEHFVLQFLEEREAIQRDDRVNALCAACSVVVYSLGLHPTGFEPSVRVSSCAVSIQIPEGVLRD